MKMIPVIRPGRITERKAKIVEMSVGNGTNMKPRKDLGFDEQCDKTGEEDEDESDGEETGEKSFFWENLADPHLQGLPHSQPGRDERGVEGDPQQIAPRSKMITSS